MLSWPVVLVLVGTGDLIASMIVLPIAPVGPALLRFVRAAGIALRRRGRSRSL